MKRRIKFVWGSSRVIKGRWYGGVFGLYERHEGWREGGLAISVRGLSLWFSALTVTGYLVAAAALFWLWERDPYSRRTYADAVLLPLRRDALRHKSGQALIARGTEAMRQQRWADAATCLRQGLALFPTDWHARLALARFYDATNQRALAMRVLNEGLADAFPGRARLAGMFAIAELGDDQNAIVQTSRRYLPSLRGEAAQAERRWLVARELDGLMRLDRFAEALTRIENAAPGDVTREQRVLVLLGLRRPADAIRIITEWRAHPGTDRAGVERLAARAYREAGQFAEMEAALDELRAQAPADPQAAACRVEQQARTGRAASAGAALEDFLFRFGGSADNLQLAAASLADAGDLALLERCAAAAIERGYAARPFQILVVTASVRGGEWSTARRTLGEMKPLAGHATEQAWRGWIYRLLDAAEGRGEAATLRLVDLLRSRAWPIRTVRATVEALRRAGQVEASRDVLALARTLFPASNWVEKKWAEVQQEIHARAPAPGGPVAAGNPVPTERVFIQRLEEALQGGRWRAAEQMIYEARRARPEPAWLAARDGDLRYAEMRTTHATGERLRMFAAAELYLNGEAARAKLALEFARTLDANGDRDSALALVAKILDRSPDDRLAQKAVAAWRPKVAQAGAR